MPKVTRDIQFRQSFKVFMESFVDTYCPDLKEWTLVNNTEKKSSSLHSYQLTIPKQIVLCEIDRRGTRPESPVGVRAGANASDRSDADASERGADETPSVEVMMTDQELPSVDLFRRVFKSHYESYELEERGRIVSYTSVTVVDDSAPIMGDLVANIEVCYHKSYLPYPSDLQSREQLMEQCRQMRIANVNLKYDLDHMFYAFQRKSRKLYHMKRTLVRQENAANEKLSNTIHRMQEKIRELYHRLGEEAREECPVCYDVMHANEIVVPGCCHFICAACNEECSKCPLCREEYIV